MALMVAQPFAQQQTTPSVTADAVAIKSKISCRTIVGECEKWLLLFFFFWCVLGIIGS